MNQSLWILIVAWLLFAVIHSLAAALRFKNWLRKWMGHWFQYYRLLYSLFALVSMCSILYYQFHLPGNAILLHQHIRYAFGIAMGVAGLALMSITIRKYFFNLSGIDVFWKKKTATALDTSGVHQWVRHPLYLGTLLFVWAWFLFSPLVTNLITCIMISLYTWIGMYFEERKLVQEFGDEYIAYQKRVPMIIPFLKKHNFHMG
ncbi:isoprenylcysteine carboxylmethyltransferase family protein [Hydrotalea sp.]|uniref:methyltransferase family protein n=1 Tax=Hydrotalea sp. TaxID=2881279 RepID=UPI0026225E47|nr:isoprenylcysteine carboxylmethyltransferase family protein [Hydrotalea sp.]